MKKCFIYIRVSTDEQAKHGASLDAQKAVCEEYAAQHGWEIVNIFIDEGISAKSTEKRVKYLEMVSRLSEVDLILCWKDDRLLRNPADAVNLSALLAKTKTDLYTVEKGRFKLELPDEEFMFILSSALGRRELLIDSQRIKNVARQQTKRGCVVSGQVPYGYKIVGEKGNKHLEIDEEKAELVKTIFNYYEKTNSLNATARAVGFSQQRIKGILKMTEYIGIYDRPARDLYVEDYCPPIISKEQFFNVQSMLKMNVKRPRSERVYIFSGLIFCSECGRRYTSFIAKGYKRYRCPHYIYADCDNKKCISEITLEKMALNKLIAECSRRKSSYEIFEKQKTDEKNKKAKLTAQKNKLIDLYMSDMIDRAEYDRRFNELNEELKSLEIKKETSGISPDTLNTVLSPDFEGIYKTFTEKEKKRFWRSVIDRIVVEESGNILISFK